MILAAVFAASMCVFGVGVWIGWWMRGEADRDPFERGYRAALHAAGWLAMDAEVE